ncbi:MAG: protoporphyrinogen oxidase [Hyphomicrobiales bacterium]|nr:protoporphyrinogen oxidase [Hyphomicrobiales bacterium]
MTTDVAVIGGGVSGLAVAYDLTCRGHKVTVLERQEHAGGSAFTEHLGDFLMERGPSTMNAHVPVAEQISSELGLDTERCELGDGVRRRYLVSGGNLAAIPMGPLGFLTSNYLSRLAKLRILADLFLPQRSDCKDETVMDFCSRRFGKEFGERIIDPMVAGIYGGRASEMSVLAIFPKLVALEKKYGSVVLGMMHRRREGGKMPGSRLFSWRNGIATLPRTLAQHLGNAVRTGITVRRISPCIDGFNIDLGSQGRLHAKSVVVATQAHVAAQLIAEIDPQAGAAAQRIHAPPLAVVFLGIPRRNVAHPLDGLGFLTSEAENRGILGAQFCSTMFAGRAPEGHVAVSAYIGGTRAPHLARLPASDLIDLARLEFRDLIGAAGDPTVARVHHWPVGLPQYGIGHKKITEELETTDRRVKGLFLTGNYFAGPSVATCLSVARETALAAHNHLENARGIQTRGVA